MKANAPAGFTLVESLLAVATLGIMAAAIGTLYMSGLTALDVQSDALVVQSQLRSEMERVVAAPFADLTNRTEMVTLGGRTYTSLWTVIDVDLDGDNVPEPDARQVTVTIGDTSLSVLQVDNDNKVSKL